MHFTRWKPDWYVKNVICFAYRYTFIGKRYERANLPHLPDYNVDLPNCEIRYLDMRALYSYCLCRPLPEGDYKWLTQVQVDNFDVWNVPRQSHYGYVLEVDVIIPDHLHDMFCDFTPLADHMQPEPDHWTSFQHILNEETGQPSRSRTAPGTKKLIGHLGPRRHYPIQIEHLKCCLKLGIQLEKVHRILRYKQSPWAREYIQHLMKKRQMAQTPFENTYFKKQSNVIFGYLLSNVRKRLKTTLVTNSDQFLRLSRKPTFKSCDIYGKHLVSVEVQPESLFLNNMVAAGWCVLELSKTHMLKFWYNFLKRIYEDKIRLLMTDTDSYIVSVTGARESMDQMMYRNRRYFDMSGFPAPYHSNANKQTPGTMKCELSGRDSILAFCGLRSKSYSLKMLSEKTEKKSKGIPRHIVRNMRFDDYVYALNSPRHRDVNKNTYQSIRSLKQSMFTVQESKTGLCSFDDKRIILLDGIHTVPYFYRGQKYKHLFDEEEDDD